MRADRRRSGALCGGYGPVPQPQPFGARRRDRHRRHSQQRVRTADRYHGVCPEHTAVSDCDQGVRLPLFFCHARGDDAGFPAHRRVRRAAGRDERPSAGRVCGRRDERRRHQSDFQGGRDYGRDGHHCQADPQAVSPHPHRACVSVHGRRHPAGGRHRAFGHQSVALRRDCDDRLGRR